ncbi:hypothetical protein F4777DRAFT_247507 [Nemania sp. FL0916]|nr:hypothetical protein F4777DRAFT_247507 [Nemania sp. FL0916]
MNQEINPAKAVLLDAPDFLHEQLPKLGNKVRGELNAIIRHNRDPIEPILQTEEDLISHLNSVPLERLTAYVNSELGRMKDANKTLNQKRSRGVHKQAARFQDFAMAFNQFLAAYSGVINIIQTADAQFGNVAFATLSLLFATVKVKAEAEESIQMCMLHISDRMPDFKAYERIYPDRQLGIMLSEAYHGIIIFARTVTAYFQTNGLIRYFRHLNGSSEFQDMEQRMRETSNRISTRCEVLLAEKIDRLMKENQLLHTRQDVMLIREVAKTLHLHDYPTEDLRKQRLIEDKTSLRHHFSNDRRLQKINARQFLDTADGKFWDGPGRGLLLLYGRNAISSSNPDSWLSLVAAELAEDYMQSDNLTVYERCTKSSTLELTLSGLILQLLERNPILIRQPEDYQEIDKRISQNGSPEERIEALRMALLRIVNCHNGRVYIILNRPELCEEMDDESCNQYVTTMLSLVNSSTTELKIMMVIKSERWDFEKNKKGINIRDLDPNLFRPVRLDQGLDR